MKKIIDGKTFELVDQENPEICECCEGCYFRHIDYCTRITDDLCVLDENLNKIWILK